MPSAGVGISLGAAVKVMAAVRATRDVSLRLLLARPSDEAVGGAPVLLGGGKDHVLEQIRFREFGLIPGTGERWILSPPSIRCRRRDPSKPASRSDRHTVLNRLKKGLHGPRASRLLARHRALLSKSNKCNRSYARARASLNVIGVMVRPELGGISVRVLDTLQGG